MKVAKIEFRGDGNIEKMIGSLIKQSQKLKKYDIDLQLDTVTLSQDPKKYLSPYNKLLNRKQMINFQGKASDFIDRYEVENVIELYTKLDKIQEVRYWLETIYPSSRYDEIPITDIVYELYTFQKDNLVNIG